MLTNNRGSVGDWAILNKAEIELFVQSGGSGRIIR